jgi:SAM-dependent methyltransferase
MDDSNFEQARYAGMRWNTPLSEEHAARLLERLAIGRRQSVLDLGCGAAHAWGGARRALPALARLVAPGGRVLFGDGIWESPPTEPARELFGDDVLPEPELHRLIAAAGWRVLSRSRAELEEWDAFEEAWRAGREEWRLAHAGDPRAAAVAAELAERLTEYVDVYRGVLGFTYLVLTR